MKRIVGILGIIITSHLLTSCPPDMVTVGIDRIFLNKNEITISINHKFQLNAFITPSTDIKPNLIWTSSDEKVISVDSNGLVSALSEGDAIITVATEDENISSSCFVSSRYVTVTGINIDMNSIVLYIGDLEQISANTIPENASNAEIHWTTMDESVAIVDSEGIVTAKDTGSTIIQVKANENGFTKNCTITVIPFFEKKIKASDTSVYSDDNEFGSAVSISEEFALVGAYEDDDYGSFSGAAYLFFRNQGGTANWGQCKKIIASAPSEGDMFGYSVSISGDYAIIGAYGDDASNSGLAYIFHRDEGGINNWGQLKKLKASDAGSYDRFGKSVFISGDYAIIGAPDDDEGGTSDTGSAYIFHRDEGGTNNWGQLKKLTASDATSGSHFGCSVSISGDLALIGSYRHFNGISGSGTAYLFQQNQGGSNNWGEIKKIIALDSENGDYFGSTVSIYGNNVVIGAPLDDDSAISSGSAYIFSRNQGGSDNWGQVIKLTDSDPNVCEYFGWSVSMNTDQVLIGAYADDVDSLNSHTGSAFIYNRNEGGQDNWGLYKKLNFSYGPGGAEYGFSTCFSGNHAFVGAPADFDNRIGSAYIYYID